MNIGFSHRWSELTATRWFVDWSFKTCLVTVPLNAKFAP